MFHFPFALRSDFSRFSNEETQAKLLPVIAIPFLAALISGSVIGLFSDTPREMFSSVGLIPAHDITSTFSLALFRSCRFILAAIILGPGLFGVLFLPILSAFRAFVFSCSVAALIQPISLASVKTVIITLAIPAFLELPAFLLAEADGFSISESMIANKPHKTEQKSVYLIHLAYICFSSAAGAVYTHFLSPVLMAHAA